MLLARRIIANYRRITRTRRLYEDAPREDRTWLAEAFAFVLVLLASDGVEALRMWSLKVQLPRAPGGVVGEAVARDMSHALGFTGATLFLLIALAIGLSLYFRFSWLSVCEKIGEAIMSAITVAQLRREAGRDRKLGEAAAVEARRQGRAAAACKIEEHEPVVIVPPVVDAGRNPSASRRNGRSRSSRTCRATPSCRRSHCSTPRRTRRKPSPPRRSR